MDQQTIDAVLEDCEVDSEATTKMNWSVTEIRTPTTSPMTSATVTNANDKTHREVELSGHTGNLLKSAWQQYAGSHHRPCILFVAITVFQGNHVSLINVEYSP